MTFLDQSKKDFAIASFCN